MRRPPKALRAFGLFGVGIVGFVLSPAVPAETPPAAVAASETSDTAGAALLPDTVGGCRRVASPHRFNGDQLYQLIDGGAPQFLEKGFSWALSGEYRCEPGGRITIEIYRMETAEGSRRVFTERQGTPGGESGIGEEAAVVAGQIEFRRGRFVVTVDLFDQGPAPAAAGRALALAIDGKIPRS